MTTQAIETHSGKRDKRFAAEIYRFVREFQNIEIRVTPENVEEPVYAFVHPPYMLQGVVFDNKMPSNNGMVSDPKSRALA